MIITPRERDLGGFSVHRILPFATHKMVGPFIFFDHMGPAVFTPGNGITVRPHPHMNLATVTYLFEGVICHRDSLGNRQLIEPGAINWMTAGHGIVHSERTPDDVKATGSRANGIQCWVAMPEDQEEIAPNFTHYAKDLMPEFSVGDVKLKLLLGTAFGKTSPVTVYSDMFYLDTHFPKGAKLTLPAANGWEMAAYVAEGRVIVNQQEVSQYSMAIPEVGQTLEIEALEDARLMLLGGAAIGKRYIYWNFVSSSADKIEQAKKDWALGPGEAGSRFPKIPGDDQEFIPLPDEVNPKGTVM
ncbi:MAG: pirin family protein [Gammaproteobacteria bacterium]